jgi:type VII secretion-associated serine protease mycosin
VTLRGRTALTAAAAALAVALLPSAPAAAHGANIRAQQWHLGFLKMAQAHQISQGEGVTVAVIDSGVANHSDLNGNILNGVDAIAGGAGNGRGDDDGHGTGMAGLIAAHGHGAGNRDGALGIAPKAKILPIRDAIGKIQGVDKPVAQGIRWAMQHGAKIINISQDVGDIETLRAVNEAQKAGVLIFAAAGNTDQSDTAVSVPGGFPWAVAVAGVDATGNHAPTSVSGAEVEIAAPGVKIVSTGLKDVWRSGTGTSDAAAIVSGVAALVWSKFPNLSAAEVLHRIEATAVDKGEPGRDPVYGFGVIDPVAALTADVPPLASPTPKASPSPLPSLASPQTDQALPGDSGSGMSPVLLAVIAAGGLLLIVIIVVAVLLATRRRPPSTPAGLPMGGPPSTGPPAWPDSR